jgi:hypothetical protein
MENPAVRNIAISYHADAGKPTDLKEKICWASTLEKGRIFACLSGKGTDRPHRLVKTQVRVEGEHRMVFTRRHAAESFPAVGGREYGHALGHTMLAYLHKRPFFELVAQAPRLNMAMMAALNRPKRFPIAIAGKDCVADEKRLAMVVNSFRENVELNSPIATQRTHKPDECRPGGELEVEVSEPHIDKGNPRLVTFATE